MKTVKFRDYLVQPVLLGEKTSTWRLFDDKALSVGDEIELKEFGKDEAFGEAVITKVLEKKFSDLTDQDKQGHETYSSDKEMYETYSGYYKQIVGPGTLLKIIWFELKEV
ncbi:MAG: ASCH domain-containing protein [Candidatus Saccharimonadales bacterium]